MQYALALITHGEAPMLDRVVQSFAADLSPPPSECVCVVDGPGYLPPVEPFGPWLVEQSPRQEGFCSTTRRLWRLASQADSEYVFWLENDFLLLRHVDLEPIAAALDDDLTLSQVQLMREPVNREEAHAGGLFWFWRGHERWERRQWGYAQRDYVVTTNPALMRREFMVENPWPKDGSECEGRFGLRLAEFGYSAGVWGDGTPWVRHVGKRRGIGY